MDAFANWVGAASGFMWNNVLVFVLIGAGAWFTLYLGGVQIKNFGLGFRTLFSGFSLSGKKAGKSGMSSFQAVATAIAAQIGTGNIVGAATALIMGGPGALFWMWIAAFLGMATIYVEATLAQHFKTYDETGQVVGGPAYYIWRGLNKKWLANLFSILIILALGFMGNMVQSNSISSAFKPYGINPIIIGVIVAVLAALIFFAGISAIASFAEKVVPIMAILYIAVGLIVIFTNLSALPGVFASIFQGAFNPTAAVGGVVGISIKNAMRYGVARGLFSNEAGMGSTPHAHAVAKVKEPATQGAVACVSVFIDTFLVLNITAFTILITGVIQYDTTAPAGVIRAVAEGVELTQQAFGSTFLGPTLGTLFVTICLSFFAFTTVVGWYYFGETNVRFLFGKKGLIPYKVLAVFFVFLGSTLKLDLVWNLSDLFNALMVLPNLVGIILLGKYSKKIMNDYANKIPYEPFEAKAEK